MKALTRAWMMLVATLAGAASAAGSDTGAAKTGGRGIIWGLGFGPGQTSFGGADRLALFVGAATATEGSCVYSACIVTQVRSGRVAPRDSTLPGTQRVVPFPTSQNGGVMAFVAGWSFSPRFAALIDGELASGWKAERFDNIVGGFVFRYSPAPRVWVEAGPAFGQLEYRYDINSFEQGITDTAARVEGEGLLAAAGFEFVRKPTLRVDAQARVGMVWYQGLRATNLSVQLGIHRRRS